MKSIFTNRFPYLAIVMTISLTRPVFADSVMDEYLDLGLEDLLSMEVTSVSKKRQSLSEAPAAIYVITQQDIQRSGVTTIPDALRMAPGIQVAKIDSNKWSISSRGFNNQFANKLLVLMDGRSVYTPSYSGVYWEIQDTVLEDIDRIEVIRGPGAALWGANAVNGVINIISKNAEDTQGGLLVAGGGDEEKAFASLRYGAELGKQVHGRVYLKYNEHDDSYAPMLRRDAGDSWRSQRAGFRLDGNTRPDTVWTLQGDVYNTEENEIVNLILSGGTPMPSDIDTSGWNILGRIEHRFQNQSLATLQLYFDHTERDEAIIGQEHDTFDVDFQHQFSAFDRHDIIWGFNYRRVEDRFDNTPSVSLSPTKRTTDLFSVMLQDEISIIKNKLRLTVGSKFEHNDFTGFEYQPSARLLWLPAQGHSVWTSVSRAVRTPSRIEHDSSIATAVFPPPVNLAVFTNGSDDFDSEDLMAYELGYRWQPTESLSLDAALFYNKYDDVATFEPTSFVSIPFVGTFATNFTFDNKLEVESHGLELVADWRPKEWWRLQANYSYIRLDADYDVDSRDIVSLAATEGSTPQQQLSIRSQMDLTSNVMLDMWGYYVDQLPNGALTSFQTVPDYFSLNARLAWRPIEAIELSVVGMNILQDRHAEFTGELQTFTEVERSFYGQLRWDF